MDYSYIDMYLNPRQERYNQYLLRSLRKHESKYTDRKKPSIRQDKNLVIPSTYNALVTVDVNKTTKWDHIPYDMTVYSDYGIILTNAGHTQDAQTDESTDESMNGKLLFDWKEYTKYLHSFDLWKESFLCEKRNPYNFEWLDKYLNHAKPLNDTIEEWIYNPQKIKYSASPDILPVTEKNLHIVATACVKKAIEYGIRTTKGHKGVSAMSVKLQDERKQAVKAMYLLQAMYSPDNEIDTGKILDELTQISTGNDCLALYGSAYEGILEYLSENDTENLWDAFSCAGNKIQQWIKDHANYQAMTYHTHTTETNTAQDASGTYITKEQAEEAEERGMIETIKAIDDAITMAWYIDIIVSLLPEKNRKLCRQILEVRALAEEKIPRKELAEILCVPPEKIDTQIRAIQRVQKKHCVVPTYRHKFHTFGTQEKITSDYGMKRKQVYSYGTGTEYLFSERKI